MTCCAEVVLRWSVGWPVFASSCPGRGEEGRRLRACGGLYGETWKAERMEMIEALGKRQRAVWTEGWTQRGRPQGFLA